MKYKGGDKVKIKGLLDSCICVITKIYKSNGRAFYNVFNLDYVGTEIVGEYTLIWEERLIPYKVKYKQLSLF